MTPVSASFAHSGVPTYFLREETQKERVIVTPLGLYSLACVMAAVSCETEWVTHGEGYGAPGSPPGCKKTPPVLMPGCSPRPCRGALQGKQGSLSFMGPSAPRGRSSLASGPRSPGAPGAPLKQNPVHSVLPHGGPGPNRHPLPLISCKV